MLTIIIIAISILLQLTAAWLAFSLVKITKHRLSWTLIAAAISLMAVRRCISLFRTLSEDTQHLPDLPAELIAMSISILMVVGIAGIAPLFRTLQNAAHTKSVMLETENMLASVLDAIPVRVYWKDRTLRYVGCNRLFAQDVGLQDHKTIAGKMDQDLPWQRPSPELAAMDRAVLEQGKEFLNAVHPHVLPDGTTLWFESSKVPLTDRNGKIIGILGVCRDITQRIETEVALQEREREYFTLLSNLSGMAYRCALQPQLRMEFVSEGSFELTGFRAAELTNENGLKYFDLIYPQDRIDFEHMRSTHLSQKVPTSFEYRIATADGNFIWVWDQSRGIYSNDGELLFVEGLVTNINERKRIELELNQYRDHLQSLVETRTSELEASNRELEAFSYSVSHDLRAPLRTMQGFTELVLDNYADALAEDAKLYLTRVSDGGIYMQELIEDLLSLAKLSKTNLHRQHLNMSEMAETILLEMQQQQDDRHIEYIIHPAMEVMGDKRLIEVLLRNLIGNAWKYTARRPLAHIEFGVEFHESETVFFIKDNGIGFDNQHAEKLFQVFHRLHCEAEFDGTGIGLAIVARIVARHGGQVWASGKPDSGASFYFTLPFV